MIWKSRQENWKVDWRKKERIRHQRKELEMKAMQIRIEQEHEVRLENIRQQGQNERHTVSQTSSNTSIGYTGKERMKFLC